MITYSEIIGRSRSDLLAMDDDKFDELCADICDRSKQLAVQGIRGSVRGYDSSTSGSRERDGICLDDACDALELVRLLVDRRRMYFRTSGEPDPLTADRQYSDASNLCFLLAQSGFSLSAEWAEAVLMLCQVSAARLCPQKMTPWCIYPLDMFDVWQDVPMTLCAGGET